MPRDYRVFLDDILEAARKVLEYTAGFSYEQFLTDRKTVEAVVWNAADYRRGSEKHS